MGRITWCVFVLCASTWASPHSDTSEFLRSAVETVPQHDPIAAPIRSSVESIPLRSLREEGEGRLPLRDAVEKRPISLIDRDVSFKTVEDVEPVSSDETFVELKNFYGAASYLNNKNDERLQHGNENLQEMQQTSGTTDRRMVVCYLQSWAAYRAPPLAFTAGLVPRSCTHLHYAFAAIHPHTYAVIPANEDYDIIKGGYRIATGLKRRLQGLKVIVSVGGEGTERLFSELVQEPKRRSLFIDSAVDFLREHDFDGLDLHWVYPGERDEKDKELLTSLLYELREKFSSYGFLLSTVLPPFRYQIEDGYDLSAVSGATDYTILQAWDMTHGKKDEPPSRAVHHATLHRDPGAASRDQRYENIEFMVKYIIRHGMAADKLVLGIPLFGRSYTLAPSTLPSPGAQVSGWGEEGQYTQTRGMLAYFEICMAEREGKGVTAFDEAGNSFALFENQWVSFDSQSTVLEKMRFVISTGLAGAAAWSVDMDDFRGLCGTPFPILSTISTSLNGESIQSDQSTLKIGVCDSHIPYLASDEDSCAHFHFCTGGINYKMLCEEERLYDPSTGFCGHQDVAKCIPGQSLRISVHEAERFLSQAYETDFEWNGESIKDIAAAQLMYTDVDIKKTSVHGLGMRKNVYTRKYNRYTAWDSSHRPQLSNKKKNDRPNIILTNLESNIKQIEDEADKENDKKVVCYMTSWAFYRRGDGKFVPEHIDSRLCTHVVYAYASLSPDELIAKEFDPWADITNNLYERVTSLKDVKVLLGLGGWTDSAGDKYSRLVSSDSARAKFIQKLIPFLRMHNFNGLHLDWNYPVCWQSNCKKGAASDKANYATLVQELSKALHAAGMELGVALSGYKEVIDSAYDLPAISRAADFMSTMTYDYHGGWERKTAHHTPLVPEPGDALAYYSIEYAINALLKGGADPKKLLLGLSFYGQSYRLAEVEGPKGPGVPAAGPGEAGEFTKQPGMLAYYEICYRVKNLRWKTGRQANAGPYTYSDSQWVGYDDPKSITEKVEWALRKGLGGVSAWAIDLDDFNNRCCAEPSPLLRAAGRALGRSVPSPGAECERPPQPVTPAPPTTTTVQADGSLGGGGDHGSHDHGQHTSTTWPGWVPSATTSSTAQTWWPAATTPSTTTTTTTTTTTSTTTRRPIAAPVRPPPDAGSLEGTSCNAGDYRAAPGDCEGYLQCEGGQWRKQRCAPGLHWAAAVHRCDWPSFAKCAEESSSNEASTATSTLAPMTSRPPPKPTTTTKRTTTSTYTTTTTTTTTTARPTTTSKPATSAPVSKDELSEGKPCREAGYQPASDCNSYLQCDGNKWYQQQCAPGLHWSPTKHQCDWPKYAKCKVSATKPSTAAPKPTYPAPKPTSALPSGDKPFEDGQCSSNEMHAPASSCDSYLMCVGGRWRKQLCPPGLHWDKRTSRCDWVEFAMCEERPSATKSPLPEPTTTTTTTTTTRKPTTTTTTTRRPTPAPIEESHRPSTGCNTGTYYPHPKCEKFFVCVNNLMVAQSCAPGLVWSAERSQCDFPSSVSCTDRRQIMSAAMTDAKPESTSLQLNDELPLYCDNGQYAMLPTDCTRYQHCIFGKFEEFSCSAGLHWNQDKQICDWPSNAKCKVKSPPKPTTLAPRPTTLAPKPESSTRPTNPTKPVYIDNDEYVPEPSPPKPVASVPATGTLPDLPSKPPLLNSRYKLVCYYTNWSWYRPGIGKYSPEDIDPTLCTHIVYGFAVLGNDGLMTAHDSWADYDNRFYERVVEYKRKGIKVSLALGGWNDSAGDKYSKLVNDPAARAKFVRHAVSFLEKYDFDGLDLDWEYPKCWQVDCSKGPDSDKQGFADLVRELSAVLKPKGLLLSAAVSPNKMVIDAGYDVPVLARLLDWIAVMTYDYHGQWDKKTGHVAPLYYHPDDDTTYFNANYTIHYWMEKGAPASKLIMGMPMYGQSFTIGDKWDKYQDQWRKEPTGLNIPVSDGGEPGEYTRAKGFLAFYEICDRIRNNGWKVVKDPYQRMGPYAYKGNQWVSFDDVDIIKKKVNFVKSLNLGGAMIWALDLDDYRNRCGQGKHPLLNAIKTELINPKTDIMEMEIQQKPQKPQKPIYEPPNNIDDDLDDIHVPIYHRPTARPTVRPTSQMNVVSTTTKKPMTAVGPVKEERFKVVCYYTNWAWYRPDNGKYTPNDINPELCTHIIYAFAVLDKEGLVIKSHDIWLDVENKFYEKVTSLKSHGVKVLLGLGGWDDSAGDKYSRLVNNVNARRKFVVHTVDFLEQYGFDGLDLDWEYPKCWQVECEKGPDSDKQGFANLVKELRTAFNRRGLLLSAAVSASKRVIDFAYDVPTLSENLDWIALMTYDYHGQWDKKTGHVAPMYIHDKDSDNTFNVNFTVNYWINKGADRQKLVMGVPFYGQSFSLVDGAGNGLGTPTYAGGEAGDETRARGFLAFYEICERIRVKGWKVFRDPGGRIGPYASDDDQWVSFDDDFMARHKAEYVRAMGLGGSMAWSLDLDDFTGKYCGCGKAPLLTTINHVLRGREAPPPCSLEEMKGSSPVSVLGIPTKPDVPEAEQKPMTIDTDHHHQFDEVQHESSVSSLDGKPCSGAVFKADDSDCAKYYLCVGKRYMQLTCPAPLVWNQNHCDWPEKSQCKGKTHLRIKDASVLVMQDKPIIACYFTNWAYYRHGNGSYGPEQVDPSMCTHIVYAWAHLDPVTYSLVPGNPELDIDNDFFGKMTELRMKGVKVIIGAGGLEDSEDDKWAEMTSSPENMDAFVESVVKFLNRWNFDGLQIAWQYPVCKQTPCTDFDITEKENFSILLAKLSKTLHQHNFELSALVSSSPEIADLAYDPEVLAATSDWIALAANDYYASTSGRTAYLVPLETIELAGINSFNTSLAYWSSLVPVEQLVIGVPAYARSYTLRSAANKHVQAPVAGPGIPGHFTRVPGFLAYYEMCPGSKSSRWQETRTEDGTFAVHRSQWASYLRPEEVHRVGASAATAGLRGAALWALDLDDFRALCSCETNPLLAALRQGLLDPNISPTLCN